MTDLGRPLLQPSHGFGLHANYYIIGKLHRKPHDNAQARGYVRHCRTSYVQAWGPEVGPDSYQYGATCTTCGQVFYSHSLEGLYNEIMDSIRKQFQ